MGSLAVIEDTHADMTSLAKLDGEEVVAFSIIRSKGASETSVVAAVDDALADLQAQMTDLKIEKIVDTLYPLKKAIKQRCVC